MKRSILGYGKKHWNKQNKIPKTVTTPFFKIIKVKQRSKNNDFMVFFGVKKNCK